MSTATDIADLRDQLSRAEAMAAQCYASGDRTNFAVQSGIAHRLRKQIAELES